MPTEDANYIVNALNNLGRSLENSTSRVSSQASKDFSDMANQLARIIQQTAGETQDRLDAVRKGLFAVQSGLDLMRELIERTGERTIEEIQKGSELNGRMEVAKQMAALDVVSPSLANQAQGLEQQHENIDGRMERVGEKYDDMSDELEESYNRDIRRLGDYIYNIVENEYGLHVADSNAIPGFQIMAQTTKKNTEEREAILSERLALAAEAGRNYVESYDRLEQGMKAFGLDRTIPGIEEEQVAIPFWIVTVENAEGKEETWVIPPSMVLSGGDTDGETMTAAPLAGYAELQTFLGKYVNLSQNQIAPWKQGPLAAPASIEEGLKILSGEGIIGPLMLGYLNQALADSPIRTAEGVSS